MNLASARSNRALGREQFADRDMRFNGSGFELLSGAN